MSARTLDSSARLDKVAEKIEALQERAADIARDEIKTRLQALSARFPNRSWSFWHMNGSSAVEVSRPILGQSRLTASHDVCNVNSFERANTLAPEAFGFLLEHIEAIETLTTRLEDEFNNYLGEVLP